jgi:dihydropyrimidinase
MFDLVVRNGTVITPTGARQLDIGIQGELIAALGLPETLPLEGAQVIDVAGKVVAPGGIEAHAHVAWPIPALPDYRSTGPREVSAAALYGGTTTIVDFAAQAPGGDLIGAVEARNTLWGGQSYADYSYHVMPTSVVSLRDIEQLPDLITGGFPSIKVFTTSVRPPSGPNTFMVDFGRLALIMERLAKHGGIAVIHSEDDDIVQHNYRVAQETGRWAWTNLSFVHDALSEDLSYRRVIRLAQLKEAALYLVHVSAKAGVNAVDEARRRSQPVYGETLHNYISFTEEHYREPDGMKYHTYPSLKSEGDRQALWGGLLDGELSTIATDHISTPYHIKTMGRTVADCTGGHNGIETRMGIMYTEGVVRRGMSLERFAEVTATGPARLLGLYPRKGVIQPGSDADLAVIDPSVHRPLSQSDLHLEDYSIWEGWPIEGWPVMTVLRGRVAVAGGKLLAQPGWGRLLPRKIEAGVLTKPVSSAG